MLEVRGLTTGYGKTAILNSVSLTVDRAETVAVLGPNGAGKTTLVSAIAGLLPTWSGSTSLDGEDLSGMGADQVMRRGVSLVPAGRQIFGPLTVRENLLVGGYGRYRALGRTGQAEQLEYVLGLFPVLKERLSSLGRNLSGGQQQMLAIGRALMGRPSILLLDEPTIGLAPLVVERLYEKLQVLQADNLTMLLVEQNARLALQLSTRAYVLELGGIALSGASAELRDNPRVRDLYLGGSSEDGATSEAPRG